jgi:hypothetical protein
MPADDNWWDRQLIEAMKESSQRLTAFKAASQPNVDDLDQASRIHEEYCQAYDLTEITFEEFTEIGESLRARQAREIFQKDDNNE